MADSMRSQRRTLFADGEGAVRVRDDEASFSRAMASRTSSASPTLAACGGVAHGADEIVMV